MIDLEAYVIRKIVLPEPKKSQNPSESGCACRIATCITFCVMTEVMG